MAYKLTPEDCHNVVNDEPEIVHQQELGKLHAQLALANEIPEMYRLQGRIAQLMDDMSLKHKAINQLNSK